MRANGHLVALSAARLYAPLILFAALIVLVLRTPGAGVGFLAGLLFAAALGVHLLVFGATAARAAAPLTLVRGLACLGVLAAMTGAGAPRLTGAVVLLETGLFVVTAAGATLVLAALAARAPMLRDEVGS